MNMLYKCMLYTVLESYAYHNILIIKYFSTSTNFSGALLHTYSDLLNPDSVAMEIYSF